MVVVKEETVVRRSDESVVVSERVEMISRVVVVKVVVVVERVVRVFCVIVRVVREVETSTVVEGMTRVETLRVTLVSVSVAPLTVIVLVTGTVEVLT